MKTIGIDARFYGPFGKGLGRYTQQLILHLERLSKNFLLHRDDLSFCNGVLDGKSDEKKRRSQQHYIIFLRQENYHDYISGNPFFRKVLANYPWYTFTEQLFLPLLLYRQKVDLMHFLHFNVPVLYFRPFVLTVHDLILLHYPTRHASTRSAFFYGFKYLAYRFTIWWAIRRARHIFAVSQTTAQDIIAHYPFSRKKITVTYQGITVLGSGGRVSLSSVFFRERMAVCPPPKYALYVGNAYPHKNLKRLCRVWKNVVGKITSSFPLCTSSYKVAQMRIADHGKSSKKSFPRSCKKLNITPTLVLVGRKDYFYSQLQQYVQIEKIPNVLFFGHATDEELGELYRNAHLYIFPSLYEGFGLPPLEATYYGIPIASSNRSCLPEILNDGAAYFNPEDEEEMLKVIARLWCDKKEREVLIKKAINNNKRFSWQKMAQQTQNVYDAQTTDV